MALLRDVLLKKPNYANFDLSSVIRGSAAPGVLYPVRVEEMLPGDTFKFSIPNLDTKTYPLLSPYYGSFKCQVAFFFIPTRLYTQAMDVNSMGSVSNPTAVSFPYFTDSKFSSSTNLSNDAIYASNSTSYVRKSSIADYLCFGAGKLRNGNSDTQTYNAIPIIGYYDIFRNYFCNVQEPRFYYRGNFNTITNGVITSANGDIAPINLSSLDDFIMYFVTHPGAELSEAWSSAIGDSVAFNPIEASYLYNGGGLLYRCHNSDLMTAFLSVGTYNNMLSGTAVSTAGGSFTINQFRTANHGIEYYERGLLGGSRYNDFVYAQFGVKTNSTLCIPELLGVSTSSVVFDEVVATSDSGLGNLGGRGYGSLSSRRFTFTASEHGYFMAVMSYIPNLSYSSFTRRYLLKKNLAQLFSPAMDGLGFQPLLNGFYSNMPSAVNTGVATSIGTSGIVNSFISSVDNVQSSLYTHGFGYQPSWIEYTSAVNETHGDFNPYVGDLSYWVSSRLTTRFVKNTSTFGNFLSNPSLTYADIATSTGTFYGITDPTTYILPGQYTNPFANQAFDAENFVFQIPFDLFARRTKSKNPVPHL